jgi:hypothetical protein
VCVCVSRLIQTCYVSCTYARKSRSMSQTSLSTHISRQQITVEDRVCDPSISTRTCVSGCILSVNFATLVWLVWALQTINSEEASQLDMYDLLLTNVVVCSSFTFIVSLQIVLPPYTCARHTSACTVGAMCCSAVCVCVLLQTLTLSRDNLYGRNRQQHDLVGVTFCMLTAHAISLLAISTVACSHLEICEQPRPLRVRSQLQELENISQITNATETHSVSEQGVLPPIYEQACLEETMPFFRRAGLSDFNPAVWRACVCCKCLPSTVVKKLESTVVPDHTQAIVFQVSVQDEWRVCTHCSCRAHTSCLRERARQCMSVSSTRRLDHQKNACMSCPACNITTHYVEQTQSNDGPDSIPIVLTFTYTELHLSLLSGLATDISGQKTRIHSDLHQRSQSEERRSHRVVQQEDGTG